MGNNSYSEALDRFSWKRVWAFGNFYKRQVCYGFMFYIFIYLAIFVLSVVFPYKTYRLDSLLGLISLMFPLCLYKCDMTIIRQVPVSRAEKTVWYIGIVVVFNIFLSLYIFGLSRWYSEFVQGATFMDGTNSLIGSGIIDKISGRDGILFTVANWIIYLSIQFLMLSILVLYNKETKLKTFLAGGSIYFAYNILMDILGIELSTSSAAGNIGKLVTTISLVAILLLIATVYSVYRAIK